MQKAMRDSIPRHCNSMGIIFASGDTDGNLAIWDINKNFPIMRVHISSAVTGLKFINSSKSEELILSIAVDGFIRVHDIRSGQCIQAVRGPHRDTLWGLQEFALPIHTKANHDDDFLSDNTAICTSGRDGIISIWGVTDSGTTVLSEIANQQGHSDAILCLSLPIVDLTWSPSSNNNSHKWIIATGSADSRAKVWNVTISKTKLKRQNWRTSGSIELRSTLHGHVGGILSIVVAEWQPGGADMVPSKTYCVTGGMESTIRLWDIDDGCCLSIIQAHSRPVTVLKVFDRILYSLADDDGLVAFYCTPPSVMEEKLIKEEAMTTSRNRQSEEARSDSITSSRLARRIRNTVTTARSQILSSDHGKSRISGSRCFQACFTQYDGIHYNYSSALAIDDGNYVALGSKTGEIWLMES